MNASWVAIDLMEFAVRTEDAVQSPEAALEWLRSFRDTLLMEGRNSRPMPWAVELLGMADVKIAKKSLARMQGQIVKLYGKDCDVDLECSKKYGEKYEKLKKILAAATTREGVDESTTGCKPLTADATHREAVDERQHPSDGELLESGKSANIYDQETTTAGKLATGSSHPAPETGTVYGRPQDRPERACCMGDGTPEPQGGPKSGNHYDKESLDKAGAGESTPESVSAPSPALPVPTKRPHGEFGNVMLTDDEFAKLQEKTPNALDLITELDQYIESQGKTKKYKSHYATLLNWSRRKAQESKPKQGYKNINDINQENYEKAMREIEAMCAGEAV